MKTLEQIEYRNPPAHAARGTLRGETSYTLYLREIGKVKLLTPQEEIELAARIKKGDEEARDQLIKANLRLVVKIARHYDGLGVPLLDLIGEGNIGLMKAVERFDPSKGAKLSYFSAPWIKGAITDALANQSKAFRLPTHVITKLSKLNHAAFRLEEELGREPTDDELAAEVGMTSSRITRMRMAAIRPASLDARFDDEEDSRSFAETLADTKAESPYESLEAKTVAAMLWELLNRLDRREQAILRSRFGLDGEPPKTLQQIGEELGTTGERARQLQETALEKLRRRINSLENGPSPRRTQLTATRP